MGEDEKGGEKLSSGFQAHCIQRKLKEIKERQDRESEAL